MKLLAINKKNVAHCVGFVTDGCHKFYLCESLSQFKSMEEYGYTELCPMTALEKSFDSACPLRFIEWADLRKAAVVPQCAREVTFKYDKKTSTLKFDY